MPHTLTPRFATYLRRVPKTDLHCHVVGAMRPGTLADLAHKHRVPLPRPAEQLYTFSNFYDFLEILNIAATVLREREDFARLSYEILEDGYRAGNMLHAELLFNPQYHMPQGVSYPTVADGLADGIRAARQTFGVSALLVASFDRIIDPGAAQHILDQVIAHRVDEVVGIGLDGAERNGPPGRFVEVYQRAGQAGLRRTAHVCEDNQTLEEAPPRHYAICHDDLHCDRLDHGYNLLADPAMIDRARDDGLFFNVCTVTSVTKNLERRGASIGRMVDEGLRVTVNTDDPTMFKTDLADSYQRLFATRADWGAAQARKFSLAGVEASWLDETEKQRLRERFEAELAALDSEEATPPR